MTDKYIIATPEEAYRPRTAPGNGCVSLFLLVIFLIGSFFAGGITQGHYGWNTAFAVWAAFGLLALIWTVVLVKRTRNRRSERTGIDVLRSVLDFQLPPEYYGVGLTAFCRPDKLSAGSATALLIFAQNYANRTRRVILKFPKSPLLGDLKNQTIRWELSPGQCVLFRACVQTPVNAKQGYQDFTIKIQIKMPKGQGSRLIPKVRSENSIQLTRLRSASFGVDVDGNGFAAVQSSSENRNPPQFISLYTPALAEPRFEVLQQVSTVDPCALLTV
jgi:hypothetical protein